MGCTNWDTADGYGDSEDLIGKWFKLHPERRDDIFLATKFGLRKNSDTLLDYRVDSSPEYCKEAIEKSLKRLGVSHVDLYYIHRANPETPIEKTVKAMRDLVQYVATPCSRVLVHETDYLQTGQGQVYWIVRSVLRHSATRVCCPPRLRSTDEL